MPNITAKVSKGCGNDKCGTFSTDHHIGPHHGGKPMEGSGGKVHPGKPALHGGHPMPGHPFKHSGSGGLGGTGLMGSSGAMDSDGDYDGDKDSDNDGY